MTAENPPFPYYDGIPYNSEFFTTETSSAGLSETKANTLYLRKTTPDTASALETFNGGLATTTLTASGIATFNNSTKVLGNTLITRDVDISPTSSITLNPASNTPFFTIGNTTDTMSLYTASLPTLASNIQIQNNKTLNIA
jgi:hypothetical protein